MALDTSKLNIKPTIGPESKSINEVVEEGEKIEAFLFLAEKSLKLGDLTSASEYVRNEFHSKVPLYSDCAKLFEKIGDAYLERKDYGKAIEHLEYAVSAWTKEAERLESQERNANMCYLNIENLQNKLKLINQEQNNKLNLNRR